MESLDLDRSRILNIRVRKGQAIDHTITVNDANGDPFDFTGYSAEMFVYTSFSKSSQTEEYEIGVSLSSGAIRIHNASINNKREEFVYLLWITDPDGFRQPWLNGEFTILNRLWDSEEDTDTIVINPEGDDITITISPIVNTGIMSRTVSISSAEILNLHNSPIDMIPAPGEGYFIRIISVDYLFTVGDTVYSTSGGTPVPLLYYEDGVTVADNDNGGSTSNLITSVVNRFLSFVTSGGSGNVALSLVNNKKVILKMSIVGRSFINGTGTLKVSLKYRIVEI